MAKGFHPFKRTSPQMPSNSSETNNNSTGSSINSSRSGLGLSLNQMAIPIFTSQRREDVDAEGQALLRNFLHEEFQHEGLDEEDFSEVQNPRPEAYGDVSNPVLIEIRLSANRNEVPTADSVSLPSSQAWIAAGSCIRNLADQFAASSEREGIRRQADTIELGSISRECFYHLMNQTFQNGIDKYRLVALFYFCSDVLIRCVKQGLRQQGPRLFLWCMEFLIERVCTWVYEHGGWENVLNKVYNAVIQLAAFSFACVVIVSSFVYIKRMLQ